MSPARGPLGLRPSGLGPSVFSDPRPSLMTSRRACGGSAPACLAVRSRLSGSPRSVAFACRLICPFGAARFGLASGSGCRLPSCCPVCCLSLAVSFYIYNRAQRPLFQGLGTERSPLDSGSYKESYLPPGGYIKNRTRQGPLYSVTYGDIPGVGVSRPALIPGVVAQPLVGPRAHHNP